MVVSMLRRPYFRTGGNFGSPKIDLGGCVFYAPLWRPDLASSPFTSKPPNPLVCTVAGAVWSNQGYILAGGDDYITIPNPPSLDFERTSPFSVTQWFKRTATNSGGQLACKQLTAPSYQGWYTYVHGANYTLGFVLRSDTVTANYLQVDSTPTYTNNLSWICLTVTYDGSSTAAGVVLIVDGAVIADGDTFDALTGTTLNTAPFNIGARNDVPGWAGGGTFGDVIIHNRVLSLAEAKNLRLATMWRYT